MHDYEIAVDAPVLMECNVVYNIHIKSEEMRNEQLYLERQLE